MMPIALPRPSSAERNRLLCVDELRLRALERLYQRREAVDALISSLEEYQKSTGPQRAACVEFSSARKCS